MEKGISDKIAISALIVFLGMIVSKILTYIYRLIVARYLGPEEYGTLNLSLTILFVFLSIALIAHPSSIVRYVSFYKGKNEEEKIKGTITAGLKLNIITSVVIGIILFIGANYISINIFHTDKLIPLLKLFAFLVPVISLGNIFQASIEGFQKVKYTTIIRNFSESSIQTILTLVLLLLGLKIMGAALGYFVALTSSTILLFIILQKKVYPILNKKIKSFENYKELINYSMPLLLLSIINIIIEKLDILSIGYFLNLEKVGLYNAALPLASLSQIIPVALTAIFMPVITELYAKNNIDKIKELYKKVSRWIFIVNIALVLMLIFFSDAVLNIFFGPLYIQASQALIIIAIGYFVYYQTLGSHYILYMLGKTRLLMLNAIIVALLNIILNIILIPKFGIVGAATALAITYSLLGILQFIEVYFLIKANFLELNYIKIIISIIFAVTPLLLIKYFSNTFKIYLIIIYLIIFFMIYLIFLKLFKIIDKEDYYFVKRIILKKS